jgi:hypothetical protein
MEVLLRLAPEIRLGKLRALIRPLGLLADQDDPPVEALLAERGRGTCPGEARTDDDMGLGPHLRPPSRDIG